LIPCLDPVLVPDPDNATAEQINIERINVARAYVDCKQRHADLVTFVNGDAPASPAKKGWFW